MHYSSSLSLISYASPRPFSYNLNRVGAGMHAERFPIFIGFTGDLIISSWAIVCDAA